jgi:dephospho-CoA kinase
MLVIGLTGGIGSGKSTAAEQFAKLGAAVIDTDLISHQLTANGQPALAAIAAQFGSQYLQADGALDRSRLRALVFSDSAARKQLEAILHPRIREEVARMLQQPTAAPYHILVVPLLLETGAYGHLVNRVLVVDCPETLQIQRVMGRGTLSEAEVRAILRAQCKREERLARADDIIVNDSGLGNLQSQIADLHKKYIALA